jgi:uncharacterized protein involved in exopolysaccharide biosynthesis
MNIKRPPRPPDVGAAHDGPADVAAPVGGRVNHLPPPGAERRTNGHRPARTGNRGRRSNRRHPLRTLLTILGVVAASVLFGAVGWYWERAQPPSYTASALVRLAPDPVLPDGTQPNPTDINDRFVQSELLSITADAAQVEVARRTGSSAKPSIKATQIGTTDVIEISATASDRAQAVLDADAAAATYVDRRTTAAVAAVARAKAVVEGQLAEVDSAIAALPVPADPSAPVPNTSASRGTALADEYARLLSVDHQIATVDPTANPPATVVDPAAQRGAASNRSPARMAVIGALIGALLAIGVAVVDQRAAR